MPRTRENATPAVPVASRLAMWAVDRLRPYDRNPRRHSETQIEAMVAAIREFGFTAPILVDEAQGILAGHGRLEAAKRMGMREVPVVELTHMTPAQKRAYIIADNKLPAMATWDERVLADELRALEADGFDLLLTGFSDDDLQRLQDDLDQHAFENIADAAAPAQANAAAPTSTVAAQPGLEPPPPSGTQGAAAPVDEMLPFSVVMTADDRARLFEAIAAAKRKWDLSTSAHALLALANDFLGRQA